LTAGLGDTRVPPPSSPDPEQPISLPCLLGAGHGGPLGELGLAENLPIGLSVHAPGLAFRLTPRAPGHSGYSGPVAARVPRVDDQGRNGGGRGAEEGRAGTRSESARRLPREEPAGEVRSEWRPGRPPPGSPPGPRAGARPRGRRGQAGA
jgi:hypothetical protein